MSINKSSKFKMNRVYLVLLFIFYFSKFTYADRIFILEGVGYNAVTGPLLNAIINNGHTVVVENDLANGLPAGFTTRCVDPTNGYDWLCFFGNESFVSLTPQIQAYIDAGGKVFYQYEVTCCTTSSMSVAEIASSLTGLTITPNANAYIALNASIYTPAWESEISCCITMTGNAYKGMDGLPVGNQMNATATLNGSSPPISTCTNFGFIFTGSDFISGANNGAFVGFGDVNIWYNGNEAAASLLNEDLVAFIFPNNDNSCHLFPPGCDATLQIPPVLNVNLGTDTTLCTGEKLTLYPSPQDANSYLWQDNSSNSTFLVSDPGTYWVMLTVDDCSAVDSIYVDFEYCSGELELPNVITSNGDGINEIFTPIFSKGISSMHTILFNRWGNVVFDTDDLNINWSPQNSSDGVYFWLVRFTNVLGTEQEMSGTVTVFNE